MSETPNFTRSQLRIADLKNNRIDHNFLCGLIKKYQTAREKNPNCRIPSDLAEVFLVLIDKMLYSASWKGYSQDWQEDFRGLAIQHLCKYSIRFNPEKCTDATNYFFTMISNSFKQALKKCKTYHEHFGEHLDDNMVYESELEKMTYTPDYL